MDPQSELNGTSPPVESRDAQNTDRAGRDGAGSDGAEGGSNVGSSVLGWAVERLAAWLWVMALLLLLASMSGLLGRLWWLFDLATHFRVQYVGAAVVGTLLALLMRRWRLLVPLLLCLSVNLYLLYPLYNKTPTSASAGESLCVLSINVHSANRDHDAVIRSIRAGDPDVFFVLEFNEYWQEALHSLEAEYPHSHHLPRDDSFGMAVYSRVSLESTSTIELQHPGFTAIAVGVERDGAPWTLLGVHVIPPVSAEASALRNRQFAQLAGYARAKRGALVVLGDLNCTGWSPHFAQLLADSGLRNSQLGHGAQPTWPVQLPLLMIPIDHCLLSPDLAVQARWLGEACGSDHRGLFVKLSQGDRTAAGYGP